MELRGFRIHVALLVFVIVMVSGLVGQYYLRQSKVIAPLAAQIQELPGVEESEILQSTQGTIIQITLNENTALPETIKAVRDIAAGKPGQFKIRLTDNPSEKLLGAFQEMRFVIEEAVMLGNFQDMAAEVNHIAGGLGIGIDLGLDREYVYVQLKDGEHILYGVISRLSEGEIVAIDTAREVNRG